MKWSDPTAFSLVAFDAPPYKQKALRSYASAASALHPRVADWISAAPILAVALNDQRYYQALFDLACARGKLVEALRICRIPTPMRKQSSGDADQWHRLKGWCTTFPEMPDSELAQLIAKNAGFDRENWCRRIALAVKRRPAGIDCSEYARWAVRTCAVEPDHVIRLILDFMQENEFSLSWSVSRFKREHHAWVERMHAEWEERRVAQAEAQFARQSARRAADEKALDVVTIYKPFPLARKYGVVEIVALDTGRKLLEEGARMRHCVGGTQFRSQMRKGKALYFHLQAGSERSTLEIQKYGDTFRLGQHCGVCNQRPHSILEDAARQLVHDALAQRAEDHNLKEAAG